MFFRWPPVRLACPGHAVRKEVASKTPYQDRDGAILPFFLFFCCLFEYLLVVSIVHFRESSMTGVLPNKRRKIFGEAMWKFSKFVFLAWLLKILIRVWTGFDELKQVDRSYSVCLFDSKFDRVLAGTAIWAWQCYTGHFNLGVEVSHWVLQSLLCQPAFSCSAVVMSCAVVWCVMMSWGVILGDEGVASKGHILAITAVTEKIQWLICLTVGRPDSGMHLSVQSPFSGSFLCSSLFYIHIRSSYILFWCGSPRLLTWSFPSLRFIPNRFHGLSKWTEVSFNNLVCMGVVWVSEPEYHFHSVFKMLSNQSLPHVYFLKSWSMEIITTKRVPLFLPGHCPSKANINQASPTATTASPTATTWSQMKKLSG